MCYLVNVNLSMDDVPLICDRPEAHLPWQCRLEYEGVLDLAAVQRKLAVLVFDAAQTATPQ